MGHPNRQLTGNIHRRRNQYVENRCPQRADMAMEREDECPDCGTRTFYRAASTSLHLGEKVKWHCPDCDYGFVQINGINSSQTE